MGSTCLGKEARSKRRDRGDCRLRLVAVGRVAAIGKHDAVDGRWDLALDGIELRERPILVVAPLDEQHRAVDAWQTGFDVRVAGTATIFLKTSASRLMRRCGLRNSAPNG